jgi:hypothetical protein
MKADLSNIIFKAPCLINFGRRGKLDKIMEGYVDMNGLAEEETKAMECFC